MTFTPTSDPLRQTEVLPSVATRQEHLKALFPQWTPMALHELLDLTAQRYPQRDWVVTDDKAWTYKDLMVWSEQIASGLFACGVQPGDHVALLMGNFAEFVAVKFAISRVGAVAVPINFLNRRDELAYVLKQSDAVLLITMDQFRGLDYLQFLDELAPDWAQQGGGCFFPKLKQVVVFPTAASTELENNRPDIRYLKNLGQHLTWHARPHPGPHTNCDIIYTSGTTGAPKGVMITHDMMLRTAFGSAWARAFEDGRRILFSLPMYHVYGYVEGLLASLFVGGAIVPQTKFDAKDTLAAIEKHSASDVLLIPTMTLALLDELKKKNYTLSSLKSVLSSGGRAPAYIWQDIKQYLHPQEITTGYGMTEVTASGTVTRPDDPESRLLSTNGRLREIGPAGDPALGNRLVIYRVVNPETGADMPSGDVGELLAKGPGVTMGYYNKPEATAEAMTSDGWFKTGDLGRLTDDGYITLMGRTKESYRCGGEQVMPSEIEDLLVTHPSVLQAHVVPVPHDRMGEVGFAFIVIREGQAFNAQALNDFCNQNLARFKVPHRYRAIRADQIPVTPSGRARKFLLVQMALAELHS
jgi:fatty-acyl-CoA synthase